MSETVFLTNFMKYLRDEGINIDEIAKSCISGDQVPDKHRESAKFMQPLVHELGKVLKLKQRECNPDQVSKDEELIVLTPRKRSPEEASAHSGPPLKQARGNEPSSHRGQSKNADPEARRLSCWQNLRFDKFPSPKAVRMHRWRLGCNPTRKCFLPRASLLSSKSPLTPCTPLLKKHHQKSELVEAASKFGLETRLAARLSMRNLSSVIAAAQFEAA